MTIDPTACTGVLCANKYPIFIEEILNESINLDAEAREREYEREMREKHNLPDNYDFGTDPLDVVDYSERDMYLEDHCEDTRLIGHRLNNEGQYEPDPEAEYSAIVGDIYAQIVRSKYVTRCHYCSPCFPYQNDLETQGEYLTFTLPPDVWGEQKPDWMVITKLQEEIRNQTEDLVSLCDVAFVPYSMRRD